MSNTVVQVVFAECQAQHALLQERCARYALEVAELRARVSRLETELAARSVGVEAASGRDVGQSS